MRVYIHMHTYTHVRACTYTCTHTDVRACTYTCTHTRARVYKHTHTQLRSCTHTHKLCLWNSVYYIMQLIGIAPVTNRMDRYEQLIISSSQILFFWLGFNWFSWLDFAFIAPLSFIYDISCCFLQCFVIVSSRLFARWSLIRAVCVYHGWGDWLHNYEHIRFALFVRKKSVKNITYDSKVDYNSHAFNYSYFSPKINPSTLCICGKLNFSS